MASHSWKDAILHWKKKLEKGANEEKILEIFGKLRKAPITLQLLQETSIGKSVNSFKKTPGEVGEQARSLVNDWKSVVKPGNTSHASNKSPKETSSKSHHQHSVRNKDKYKNVYLDNNDEDPVSNGEYSPRTNAHFSSLDDKKYLNDGTLRDSGDGEEACDSYNPTSTTNDYKSYRQVQDGEPSPSKLKNSHKHSTHSSGGDRNPKSERKKDLPQKKESTSHSNSKKNSNSSKASGSEKKHHGGKGKKGKKDLDEFTNSVASFEACLGFNDVVKSKSKPKSTKPTQNSVSSSSSGGSSKKQSPAVDNTYDPENPEIKSTSSRPSSKHETSKRKMMESIEPRIPEELKKPKLVPLEVDILSTLPDIQPNYKPLRHKLPDDNVTQKKKSLTNEEAIIFTSSRNEKTAVYAGRKNQYLVSDCPSLFESCIRVLIENIDGLGYTGGVPYDLLKPVLEKCTPAQLYTFEDYNNYLLDETDELWHVHCQRDFKARAPDESETWRDLYLRLFDEREERLKSVTANISAQMKKAVPVRTTKLAYVDSVAKPPRDVARRQMAHGTAVPNGFKLKAGPATKMTPRPIMGATNSAAAAAASQSSSTVLKKPKVAPLMQKTLKFMKQRFRR